MSTNVRGIRINSSQSRRANVKKKNSHSVVIKIDEAGFYHF